MRNLFLSILLAGLCAMGPLRAQVSDPGAMQDAEADREKLLKASDQLDIMEANSEANKTTLEALTTQVGKLQDQNAALAQQNSTLSQQLATLQDAFQKSQADRARERQVILDEVSKLIASSAGRSSTSIHLSSHKKDMPPPDPSENPAPAPSPPAAETAAVGANSSPVDAPAAPAAPATAATPDPLAPPPEAPKPQKGYYHIVEKHETLNMICSAYREQGVKVSVAQIRKANGLSEKSILKVGQKLFIPKPEVAL